MRRSTIYSLMTVLITMVLVVWVLRGRSDQPSAHLPASNPAASAATAASNPLQVNTNPNPLSTTSAGTVQQNTPPTGSASDASTNPQPAKPHFCDERNMGDTVGCIHMDCVRAPCLPGDQTPGNQ